MSTDTVLLLLRIMSGVTLLILIAVIFIALWRDYRGTVLTVEASRRVYGQLVILSETNGSYLPTGTCFPLLQITTLGRSPTNTIVVDDTFASSEHALVALRSGQWWLEDRHSRNGTTLNETLINQPIVITDGDIIGVGRMRFRLELDL
ncbi:MAG: FHA domain-containing protein [Anaerolineae bacterium]|nr:FHA domain-containing protein [Anaerolineae bacterium]